VREKVKREVFYGTSAKLAMDVHGDDSSTTTGH
jgi:hypothetical protein